jgi:hypothetical protein
VHAFGRRVAGLARVDDDDVAAGPGECQGGAETGGPAADDDGVVLAVGPVLVVFGPGGVVGRARGAVRHGVMTSCIQRAFLSRQRQAPLRNRQELITVTRDDVVLRRHGPGAMRGWCS